MTYPIDPWGPGPTRPEKKDAPEREADSATAELRVPTQPKLETLLETLSANLNKSAEPARPAAGPQPKTFAEPKPQAQPKPLVPRQPHSDRPSAFARAIGAARVVLPIVQKMLPLLEGNVASAAANLLAPSPRAVDLEPVQTAIGKLQAEHRTLRSQVSDQKRSLESIEEELTAIKEGIERNSSEIRELAEDHLKLHRRLTRLAWMIFILLFLSIGFTALLCVRLAYILRL